MANSVIPRTQSVEFSTDARRRLKLELELRCFETSRFRLDATSESAKKTRKGAGSHEPLAPQIMDKDRLVRSRR